MELTTQEILIQKCLSKVEDTLGWGKSEEWSSQDFETLSQKITDKTRVRLSVVTLKRVWGRIRYESKPTITTLNALAQFIGFENWRAFKLAHLSSKEKDNLDEVSTRLPAEVTRKSNRSRPNKVVLIAGVLFASAGVVLYFTAFDSPVSTHDPDKFKFSSQKVVDEGVPNSVIFDFNASAAKASDSVFIQQSWDKRLSEQVDRDQTKHTSIYYHPGFFQAKLRINNQVVREHNLFIKSDGWLPLIDLKPVPVYLKASDIVNDGFMGLAVEKIGEYNIPLQPTPPWIGYYKVGDFGEIHSDDMVFETEVRNDYNVGTSICQHSEVHILFEGSAMVVPLCIPGCVSDLGLEERNGTILDVAAFGADFTKWVTVRFEAHDTVANVFINEKKGLELAFTSRPAKFVGVIYRFQGTGSVNFLRVLGQDGTIVHEETFE